MRTILPALLLLLAACATPRPLRTVADVDLDAFAGDWYVIAHIPAPGEENACNGVESYRVVDRTTIETTYTYRDGGFDGPVEVMHPTGHVRNIVTNATWGMDFFWPIQFEYLVTFLDPMYRITIIGRTARDYAWIMARTPALSDATYELLVGELRRQGYDVSKLRKVPQRWPDEGHPAGGA